MVVNFLNAASSAGTSRKLKKPGTYGNSSRTTACARSTSTISGYRNTTAHPIARFASRIRSCRLAFRNACDPVNTNAASSPATVRISPSRSPPSHFFRSRSWIARASAVDTLHRCRVSCDLFFIPFIV